MARRRKREANHEHVAAETSTKQGDLDLTRREFMRRAGIVTGLAGFGLLGADALLNAIVSRMESMRATRGVAASVAREASELGLGARAYADIEGIPDPDCGIYSMYCLPTNKWNCPDSDFDCGGAGGDVHPNGFRCQSNPTWNFSGLYCSTGNHACGPGSPSDPGSDFTCRVQFTCSGNTFNCGSGLYDPNTNVNEFACDPSSEKMFACQASTFSCYANFQCADERDAQGRRYACPDAEFRCLYTFNQEECATDYNYLCNTASFDGKVVC